MLGETSVVLMFGWFRQALAAPYMRPAPALDIPAPPALDVPAPIFDLAAVDHCYPFPLVGILQELAHDYHEAQSFAYELVGLVVAKHLPQLSSFYGHPYMPIHPSTKLVPPESPAVLAFSDLQTGAGMDVLEDDDKELWRNKLGYQDNMTPGTILEIRALTTTGTQAATEYAYLATLVYPGSGLSHDSLPIITEDRWSSRVTLLVAEYFPHEERLGDVVTASPVWVERRYYRPPPAWMVAAVNTAHDRARITNVKAWEAVQQGVYGGADWAV